MEWLYEVSNRNVKDRLSKQYNTKYMCKLGFATGPLTRVGAGDRLRNEGLRLVDKELAEVGVMWEKISSGGLNKRMWWVSLIHLNI